MTNILKASTILLPSSDLYEWSVVACDQFTSQPEYWSQLADVVGDKPSTLNLIYPEVYLSQDREARISTINQNMYKYLNEGVLDREYHGYVLIERTYDNGTIRLGLLACVDLERYDYLSRDKEVRATEGTVVSRIPPRVQIRQNAPLETTHIMLLANDKSKSVIERLYLDKDNFELIYDTPLNMRGGHLRGYLITDTDRVDGMLARLEDRDYLRDIYGRDTNFCYAVGDGNHSLATAKQCWENLKASGNIDLDNHPARYCLCELVNIYDEGLVFEPIHRVIFGATDTFRAKLKALSGKYTVKMVNCEDVSIDGSTAEIYGKLTQLIDESLLDGSIGEVDYVHGEDAVRQIVDRDKDSIGMLMPTIDKSELFDYVASQGPLPRKTFSMGEANEKRYYMETRKIK